MSHQSDTLTFKPEVPGTGEDRPRKEKAWQILVVDDDPEVHRVTRLALSNTYVLGMKLNFHHAYSSAEA